VRFLDWRDGQMRNGRVVAMGDAKVTMREEGTRHEWKLPYAAVEPPTGAAPQTSPPPAPPQLKPGRGDFRCGEKVSFEDRYLQTQVGTIVPWRAVRTGCQWAFVCASSRRRSSSCANQHHLHARGAPIAVHDDPGTVSRY
jgi:hypothetical protein